jgi:hypothetical protein
MEPTQELLDDIYREKVLRARRTPPEDRLLTGLEHSDVAVRVMRDGIRAQFPDADDVQVDRILCERIALLRRLEERA